MNVSFSELIDLLPGLGTGYTRGCWNRVTRIRLYSVFFLKFMLVELILAA